MERYLNNRSRFLRSLICAGSILCLILVMFFSITSTHATEVDEYEDFGWIQVKVSVPDGFNEAIVVTVNNLDERTDFAGLVSAEDGYVTRFQVPAGNYRFSNAFLENGDYRYVTKLVSGEDEFFVSVDPNSAVYLEFKTTFDEKYAEGNEPSTETTVAAPTETTSSRTEATESSTNTGDEPETTESSTDETVPSETEDEEAGPSDDSTISLAKRLLLSLLSTVSFGAVIFGGAYLYRKHITNT